MSQYKIAAVHEGKEYVFTYGYDKPLQQYFLDMLEVGEDGLEKNYNHHTICLVGMWVVNEEGDVYGSASNLRRTMDKFGLWDKIPKQHRDAISMDLSF